LPQLDENIQDNADTNSNLEAQVTEALAAIRSEMQKQYFATVSTTKGHHKLRFKTSIPHGVIRGISAITVN